MAAAVRGGDVAGVVFHSDKGGEYVGDLFAEACRALGVTQSMGRVGSALDNAAAESWNSTLEHELLSRRRFATKDQARRDVARFIDAYNHQPPPQQLRDARHPSPTNSSSPSEPPSSATETSGPPEPGPQIAPSRRRPPLASERRRMRGSNSYQQPSTVPGEAHKARLRPMRGLQPDRTAAVVIRGHAFVQNLRRGHYELGVNARLDGLRLAAAFDELALAVSTRPQHTARSTRHTHPPTQRTPESDSGRVRGWSGWVPAARHEIDWLAARGRDARQRLRRPVPLPWGWRCRRGRLRWRRRWRGSRC